MRAQTVVSLGLSQKNLSWEKLFGTDSLLLYAQKNVAKRVSETVQLIQEG